MKQSNDIKQLMHNENLSKSIGIITNKFNREYQRQLCEMDKSKINGLRAFNHPKIMFICNKEDYENKFVFSFLFHATYVL